MRVERATDGVKLYPSGRDGYRSGPVLYVWLEPEFPLYTGLRRVPVVGLTRGPGAGGPYCYLAERAEDLIDRAVEADESWDERGPDGWQRTVRAGPRPRRYVNGLCDPTLVGLVGAGAWPVLLDYLCEEWEGPDEILEGVREFRTLCDPPVSRV